MITDNAKARIILACVCVLDVNVYVVNACVFEIFIRIVNYRISPFGTVRK